MGTPFQSDSIKDELKDIFSKRYLIQPEFWNDDIMDKNLLGKDIAFAPRDLVYLFFDIEKQFNIRIPERSIEDGRFCCFNSIMDIIVEEMNQEPHAVGRVFDNEL